MENKRKIVKNMAHCHNCGDIIESKHRHDFVGCSCGALYVDGGLEYARRVYTDHKDWTELSEYSDG